MFLKSVGTGVGDERTFVGQVTRGITVDKGCYPEQ